MSENTVVARPWLRLQSTELLLLLVAIVWGTSYGVTKSALVYTTVFLFMAIRFLLTFLLLLYPTVKDFSAKKNTDWHKALPTGVILFAIFCCEVIGISKTTATNAAILISLSAILTVFLEVLVNRLPLDFRLLGLAALSVFGVFLLTTSGEFTFAFNDGDLFILSAAFLRALMVTTTKRFTQNRKITTTSLTAIQSLVVGLGALIFLMIQEGSKTFSVIPMAWEFWALILYLVLFCTIFAFFVQNYAVRRLAPSKVSLLMGSEPLFGAIFAFLWLGEVLTVIQSVGAAIILFCVVLITARKEKFG